jgi:hypothetical protein
MTSQKLRRPRAAFLNANTGTHGAHAPAGLAKTLLAPAVMALCTLMAFAPAANADAAASSDSGNAPFKKIFLDAGLLIHASSDVTGVGFNFRGGRYLRETDRLTFDIGVCFDVDPKVTGHFSYRSISGTGPTGPIHYDGKIQINHTIVPVLLGWEHEWKIGNGRWAFRLGPVLGAAFVNGKEEREPHVVNDDNVFRSDSGTAFLLGLNTGLRWNFIPSSDRWHMDFSLTALGASDVKLDKLSEKMVPRYFEWVAGRRSRAA